MNEVIFYISGAGGDHRKGLGAYLASLGSSYGGLSFSDTFTRYPFDTKVAAIRRALDQMDQPGTAVIANSLGAYYLLHSLIDRLPFNGRVLLLSPVLGEATKGLSYSRPPMAATFARALQDKRLAKPCWLEIATGIEDTTFDHCETERVATALSADKVTLLEGQGHALDHASVHGLIRQFLNNLS